MRAKLNRRTVDALPIKEKAYDCRDTELKGFLLRTQPSGHRSWFYQYRTAEGRQTRLKLGDHPGLSPDGARAMALEKATEAARGVDLVERKRAGRAEGERARLASLRSFLDARYEPWAKTHLKSADFQLTRLRSDFKDLLDKPMHELHSFLIEGLRQQWKKAGMKPRSINRDIQRLQSVCSRAVEWGVLARHPFSGLKPLKCDKSGRVRFLNDREELALREALQARENRLRESRERFNEWRITRHLDALARRDGDYIDHLRPMVLLALNTGLRRGELLSLKWSEVNLAAKLITVVAASAKSGHTRRVPLNSEALAVLQAWRERQPSSDVLVFPGVGGNRMDNINRSWRGVAAAAALTDFKFHDLRHSFASRLVQVGVDLNTVRELLGHADIKMTLRYAHLAPANLISAVESLSRGKDEAKKVLEAAARPSTVPSARLA